MRDVFVLAFHDTGPKFGTLGTLVWIDKQVSERDDRREATELTQDYIVNPQEIM